jgi:hypothetical protein
MGGLDRGIPTFAGAVIASELTLIAREFKLRKPR